ncbi:ferritin-like-domain-containing protein [Jimgerdemannia flammicorona]|uniref:Ferritin-like-domain-containing protein n=1 Tax=Jimgerdemannia flammicorona TaxID=994334 RepID=A0A433R0H2_9FUNG|nr:ferritin-like-domain-containing protein [Jimgerdemannia flammicorona]
MSPIDPNHIHHVAIYPPIGVARVGNSTFEREDEGWYYASEAPGVLETPKGGYKDIHGRVKRQAAKFRVYAFDAHHRAIGELNKTSGYTIDWAVHVANKKGATYAFAGRYQPQYELRNPKAQNIVDERTDLIIDPGEKKVRGSNHSRVELNGEFKGSQDKAKSVYLGEIFTDAEGRLVFLAGRGDAMSIDPGNPDNIIQSDFNNVDWYDDTSDGTVRAFVTHNNTGKKFKLENDSWVLGSPPKFGSSIYPPTSLYDVIEDANQKKQYGTSGSNYSIPEVQYYRDIEPLLLRPVLISWVNANANFVHGVEGRGYFLSDDWRQKLSDNTDDAKIYRQSVFGRIRFPEVPEYQIARTGQASGYFMPKLSGDGGYTTRGDPQTWVSLTQLQYERLRKWANGEFKTDYHPPKYTRIEDYPIHEQPDKLTEAAIEWVIGAPLYPGIEVTWNSEDPDTFQNPKIKHAAFRYSTKFKPGDISMSMSLPWQSDFYECQAHWWPSTRPDDVVPEAEYKAIKDKVPLDEIAAKLNDKRVSWDRGLSQSYHQGGYGGNTDMAKKWHQLGFVVPVEAGDRNPVFVEVQRSPGMPDQGPDYDPAVPFFISSVIDTKEKLQQHLQLALRVELSTIPYYLYSMYSIDPKEDEDAADDHLGRKDAQEAARVARFIIKGVVSEEMLHLSLAGNVLLAVGGQPKLYDENVIPTFPGTLPYRVPPLPLNLRAATEKQLEAFITLEEPELICRTKQNDSGEEKYRTIGEFYQSIEEALQPIFDKDPTLFANPRPKCQFAPEKHEYSPRVPDAGGLVVVEDVKSAIAALTTIVREGEGSPLNHGTEHLDEALHHRYRQELSRAKENQKLGTAPGLSEYDDDKKLELSHYATFIHLKKKLKTKKHLWTVFPVPENPQSSQYQDEKIRTVSLAFDAAYCYLLMTIETLWTVPDPVERQKIVYGSMYGTMMGVMAPLAEFLVRQPVGQNQHAAPCFQYYQFTTSTPKTELQTLIQRALDLYTQANAQNPASQLTVILTAVENLYSITYATV